MKKLLVIIFFILALLCKVTASEWNIDTLTKLENSILGIDYSNQKTEQRLSRLEEYVYGRKNNENNNERLKRLAKDLNADIIGQEITPTEDTIAQVEEETDSSVDYPVLNDVEQKLSIPTNKNQSLHSRLVNIEKSMFNKAYDTDDFYTRVDRIKQKMYGRSEMLAEPNDYEDLSIPNFFPDELDRMALLPKQKSYYSNGNNSYKLSILEQKILKNTYPDENNNDRLARLENCVFDTEFYYDNEKDRLDRLESAIKAKRTASKYDNNKFQQKMNAALQIGTMVLMVLAFIL